LQVCTCVPVSLLVSALWASTTAGCQAKLAGTASIGRAPYWCPDHPLLSGTLPSRQGPSPCFLSPGLPGLLALTVPSPWVGGGEGRWPGRPLSPPTRCCFPLWGSQELFEDIFSLCDYFTLDDFFFFLYFLTGVAAGPPTPHTHCPPCSPPGCPALRCRGQSTLLSEE
jgi:hypothetical protein